MYPYNACRAFQRRKELDTELRTQTNSVVRRIGSDMEPRERIDRNPAVLIRRVGHQTQFLDSGTDRPGSKPLYRREVDDELFDKIPLQLFERNVLDVVFVFEESGETPATQTVIPRRWNRRGLCPHV